MYAVDVCYCRVMSDLAESGEKLIIQRQQLSCAIFKHRLRKTENDRM